MVIRGRARRLGGRWLVSIFLENRQPAPARRAAEPWIFQAELSATGTGPAPVFVPRPDQMSGGDAADLQERRRLAMAYRSCPEFAVGHGTAVRADQDGADPMRAHTVATRTVPEHELPFTDVPTVERDRDLPELAERLVDHLRALMGPAGPLQRLR